MAYPITWRTASSPSNRRSATLSIRLQGFLMRRPASSPWRVVTVRFAGSMCRESSRSGESLAPTHRVSEPRCAGRGRPLVLFVAFGFAIRRRAAVMVPVAVFLAGRAGQRRGGDDREHTLTLERGRQVDDRAVDRVDGRG